MSDYLRLNSTNLAINALARLDTISVPIAVHVEMFRWQLDLFWYAHRAVYGATAPLKAHAIVVKRNDFWLPKAETLGWPLDIPHSMCEAFFDLEVHNTSTLMHVPLAVAVPLNIQIGLAQLLPRLSDDQIIEVIDCDMFHFRPSPEHMVGPNELLVSDVYENWHLFSRSRYREVIAPYVQNENRYYNGGFVPIIGRVDTLRRILPDWTAAHIDILARNTDNDIRWWAGMYGLQVACEKSQVQMRAEEYCYVPGANELQPTHYIGHYCVDPHFTKKTFPRLSMDNCPDTPYHRLIKDWLHINNI